MTDLPYLIPTTVIEPGDGDPATRLMGRLTAGTAHARAHAYRDVIVQMTDADFKLYAQANGGYFQNSLIGRSTCDGAKIERLSEARETTFRCRDAGGQNVIFPLMTDAQYMSALSLKPGMYVVREGDLTPRELVNDPLNRGMLRVGLHRYDIKGRAVKRKAPSILYAWDKDAMEAKADAGTLTDMEKAFFASIVRYQVDVALAENYMVTRQ